LSFTFSEGEQHIETDDIEAVATAAAAGDVAPTADRPWWDNDDVRADYLLGCAKDKITKTNMQYCIHMIAIATTNWEPPYI
jgi:hypothetical protein